MAAQYQITRIKKPGGSESPTDHIEHVFVVPQPSLDTLQSLGAFDTTTKAFLNSMVAPPHWMSVEEVIENIDSGKGYFFTNRGGSQVQVIVNQRSTLINNRWVQGRKFIQTKADSTPTDNLLSLPNDYGR